jgi:OOP family OmpA-OmpF porin
MPPSLRCLLLGLLVLGLGPSASAQDPGAPPTESFSVLRFRPAPGPRNFLEVERAEVPGHLTGSVGVVFDYGHRPFSLFEAECDPDGTNCRVLDSESTPLVRYTAAAHLYGSFQLFDRLLVGAVVPLVIAEGDRFAYTTDSGMGVQLEGGSAFAIADPRLHVKGLLWADPASGLSLAASAFAAFPLGQVFTEQRFIGDRSVTVGASAILDYARDGFRASLNAGGQWREEAALFSTVVGPQVTYGVGVGYVVTPLVDVFAELTGASTFTRQADEHSLEWRLGARLRVGDVDVFLAGGTGLGDGVGTPRFRVLGGAQWGPVRADGDGDGLLDADDACPDDPEDLDGWFDEDGCPEPDNDEDGFLDADDPCPTEAEDLDGTEDGDGCPDPDDDGDGVLDGYDSCPNEPEDMDGDRDDDGCPDNDMDGDGIEDPVDQCIDQAEDFDGFGDEDGCFDIDVDDDGLSDEEDACPEDPEDFDGREDGDGCPD